MSKWAVFKTEAGELHVMPVVSKDSDFPEEPHIVDRDC